MLAIFFKHKVLSVTILILLFLSIICQILLGVIFHKMIEESDNMPTTGNTLLKQCKLKFINCYQLNGKMMNTSVFVDKFISKIRIAGLSLERIAHLSGQFTLLSILVSGICVCVSLAAGDTLFQIIPYYLVSILGLYLYFSISGIVDIMGKKKLLKTNLVDYLENHLMPRLDLEEENGKEEKKTSAPVLHIVEEEKTIKRKEGPQGMLNAADYGEELENYLKEFFA